MANNTQTQSGGIGFFGLLAIVFITLKLTGYIAWSWWWVLAPLWAPLAVVFAIFLIVVIFAAVLSKR
jgi:hypothetical protein